MQCNAKDIFTLETFFSFLVSMKLSSICITWTYIVVVLLEGGMDIFYDFQSMNNVLSFSL